MRFAAPLLESTSPLPAVYLFIFMALVETASDSFLAYRYMVTGWGDPLVNIWSSRAPPLINIRSSMATKAVSALSNSLQLFDVLGKFHYI